MKWLVFSYSLSSKINANARVRLWRKLRKLGAIAPKTGVYVLPYTEECLETLKWISLEVEQEHGDALVMKVDRFENLSDDKLINIFKNERSQDYQEIEKFLKDLENKIKTNERKKPDNVILIQKEIKKLRKSINEVAKVDYFHLFDKNFYMNRLQVIQKSLLAGNLIIVVMFSFGTLNSVVLRKMKEESLYGRNRVTNQIKRSDCMVS